MPRLKPIEHRANTRIQVQLSITRELSDLILKEQARVNVKNKSDLIVLILEHYFEEPIEGEVEEVEDSGMPVRI